MKQLITILALCVLQQTLQAQYPQVTIPGSQVRKIQSKIVNQEYELHILLPGGYEKSNKKYPVVYLMDAQWDFPLVKSIYGQYYYDGFIPELIIVGVLWGGTNPNPDSLRVRDYTPISQERMKQSGGADKFLSFMREELFPFMQTNYKADSSNRSLMGCSLGGLLTLYTLFTYPEMFTGYAAASPAIGWDIDYINETLENFAEKNLAKPVRAYITVGDVEQSRPAFEKFSKSIELMMAELKKPNVHIRSKVLENTGHSGTKSETYARGLQYIFERPDIQIDNALLDKYAGRYSLSGGGYVRIMNKDQRLVFYYYRDTERKYVLKAAGKTEFYSDSEFLKIKFNEENKMVTGFELNTYGKTQTAKKIE